ncbi:MAG: efflux RND transporter permease subunit [Alistipes onderdonkii]|nr:efflux RND transporter permease subunit [Alistipes onderdonkii]MEE0849712.1 efflux RND transporter permease subunit [Alistipes onderdonkii]
MSLPEYSLKNRKVVWFFLFVLLAGGALGFVTLGKKEDSVFVIKSASLVCSYPGATPLEVEQLVTEPIEREVQSMRLVHKITSESYYGLSKVLVELDPATRASEIPQLWDELRRKVLNIQPRLPAGASPVTVADDFGDVYGIYYGLSVDGGFTWAELRDWAQRIKTALVTVDGVQKVSLFGEQTPVVNVYVNLAALANFAIRPETIVATIGQQNTIVNSGEKQAGALQIQILEAGTYKNLDDISNQMLTAASGKQYRLGDIARVERGYADPPQTLMRVDGRRAVGIGISTEAQVDVVKTGEKITRVLDGLTRQMPVGMDLTVLYPENRIARQANATFVLNLAESVAIVILIIMLVMGFRAGVLIGSSLLFSIGGTLLLMQFLGEGLNRTSLAGFIIAMGMLVDNAIVVTDNAQQAMLRGVARRRAVVDGANAPRWSLLGATLIAIFSFLPLYLAPSSVAEIVKPLFVVLALSLLLSWVLALTQTPLFGDFMLRVKPVAHDPYDTKFYRTFDRILAALLRWRWGVVAGVAALFAAALAVMGLMPQNFFPSLDKPYFRADVLLPEGYNIRDTERNLRTMEEWLHAQPEVKTVSVTMGSTPPRYYLASSSVSLRPNFGNILVELHDKGQTEAVEARFNAYVRAMCPDVWLRSSLFKLSPVPDAAIEFGFIGDDIDTLRRLTQAAEEIMWRTPGTVNIRNSWGNRVPTWLPLYSQMKGQRIGVTRSQMAQGITIATQGYRLGEYREGDQFMPILLKDENIDTYNLTNLQALPIFTPAGKVYSIEQATDGFRFEYRVGVVKRYNRQRVMKAQCDPGRGVNTMRLYAALRDSVLRGVVLPEGYSMKVFGEQESQQESNSALARYMPLTMVLIFIVLLLLFRNYREPVVILLMIPLIFIGVVLGLAVTGKVFNFFSLLGLLGLVGMNIKNAVVLVGQVGVLRSEGKDAYEALTAATRSRIVPVAMASGTTILGMLPLLFDSMFGAMAATIMGGLLVATLLTVCVLPVVYAIFYNIRKL